MSQHFGEIISLIVAVSWTLTALSFEYASKKVGSLSLNIIRLIMAMVMLGIFLLAVTGSPFPVNAGGAAWLWLALSGLVGYVFGDFCLFNSYVVIGSRLGQLFMTLAPPTAAIAGYFFLGQKMSLTAIAGMLVCVAGIGISILGRTDSENTGQEDTTDKTYHADHDSSKRRHGHASGHYRKPHGLHHHHRIGINLPLKGVLFGIGAGIGQGVGLVLSKIGMNHYMEAAPPVTDLDNLVIPFASTQIRAIAGLAGFLIIMFLQKKGRSLLASFKDVKSMGAATGTFFGPFLGVSLSLLAVNYTEAGIASTIMALTPILIILPSKLIYKEKVTARQVIGAVISVTGASLFFI
ncbi:MAG TPA: DMT family transporter [Candidatus Coprenecus merdigallinarum]|nr:DMT family transporter [Candidatus Coprenecus merdigallinarum]